MGGWIPYCKLIFSSLQNLLAAGFEHFWIGGEVVIVLVLTQRLKEVVPQSYNERKFDLPMNCLLEFLHLSCATTVTKILSPR